MALNLASTVPAITELPLNRRVRAILLTGDDTVMFIKRVKPAKPPYWVAPGGGVEDCDDSLLDALDRELREELGATAEVLYPAFVLKHEKAGKRLEEHFYVCQLLNYDLGLRHGPEFEDPTRGLYLPDPVFLSRSALSEIDIKTPELGDYLMRNARQLRHAIHA